MLTRTKLLTLLLLLCSPAFALGPHELLVVVNGRSLRSREIAQAFVDARSVPSNNVIVLDLPAEISGVQRAITHREFTDHIWDPANAAMRERGIDTHVLAWVYSVDFPVRVQGKPSVSLQGITFLRNRKWERKPVADGTYISPLFAGPDGPEAPVFRANSFDVLKGWLGDGMPLPSMMLGVTAEHGNLNAEVLDCIAKGVSADSTMPTGTVYLVKESRPNQVRAVTRSWQFAQAAEELEKLNVNVAITDRTPLDAKDVLGVMMGSARIAPSGYGEYLPGAMCDHLTSLAGVFRKHGQSTLSDWIAAGATASAGTVVEPLSIWMKFPCARVYAHAAAGCTVMESMFQSIRCPLQLLVVGEPLASPWAPKAQVELAGLPARPLAETVSVEAAVKSESGTRYSRFMFLLDGKQVAFGTSKSFKLDPKTLSKGTHRLRAVAYSTGWVRTQAFTVQTFTVE